MSPMLPDAGSRKTFFTVYCFNMSEWQLVEKSLAYCFINPIGINDDEFCIIPTCHANTDKSMYKYNIIDNEWNEISGLNIRGSSSCFDNKNKIIYIYDGVFGMATIQKINYETMAITKLTDISDDILCGKVVYDNKNNKLHYIGVIHRNKKNFHKIWNEINEVFDNVDLCNSPDIEFSTNPTLIAISPKNIILCIAWESSTIQSYCTSNNKWTILDTKIPQEMMSISAYASTKNGQYVILLGGHYCSIISLNQIYVIDLNLMTIRESKIKTPIYNTELSAIIMSNNIKNKLVTSGFVTVCYKDKSFKSLTILPYYLIDLIEKYYDIEYVHLFQVPGPEYEHGYGNHWIMSVDDIINNCADHPCTQHYNTIYKLI